MHAHADTPSTATSTRRPLAGLAGALAFLTIVPVPAGAGLAAAAPWFPVVGAAVGALAGGVRVLCDPLVGRSVGTVLTMVALVVVTGALHQDGLADAADGLGARGGRVQRLEVMRDSATGVFGVLALISWALLMFATLGALDAAHAVRALVTACLLARWAALLHGAGAPPARSDGLGAALHVGSLALGAATVASVAAALAICGWDAGAAALGGVLLVAALVTAGARRTLGGRTGDTLGATVAIAEVVACVALLAVWHG